MLRVVLLGVLSVTSVAACKSSTDTAKSQPGVAAGKVIEVTGAVTVKHGDASRPLASGESVEGDDTVVTGADGNVVIELAHNGVRWELGPNKQQKVSASIAWKAAKSTGPAVNVDQDTAAAGRPAERSAVGTTASEGAEAPVEEAAPAAAPPAPAKAEKDEAPPRPARTRTRRESAKSAAAPPPAPMAEAEAAPSDEPPAPRRTRGPVMKADSAASLEVSSAGGGTRGGTRGPTRGATASASAAPASAATLVRAKQSAFRACLGSTGHDDEVQMVVVVTGGKATVKLTSKSAVKAALETCVKNVLGKITFGADGKVTTTLTP